MCTCDDYEAPKVIEQVFRKARGQAARQGYGCSECRKLIKHGDWHMEMTGLWDGVWNHYRFCLRCWARCEAWLVVEGCHPGIGEFAEIVSGCLRDEPEQRPKYIKALREQKALLAAKIAELEAQRAERYVAAAVERERQRRIKADLGAGI